MSSQDLVPNESQSSQDLVPNEPQRSLVPNNPQRSFLITYSQADLGLAPNKRTFTQDVMFAFANARYASYPTHWCCGREDHADGGVHYHMVVQMSAPSRWKRVKEELERETGIVVHFSEGAGNYSDGYEYVCKEDPHPLHSEPHPPIASLALGQKISRSKVKRKQTVTEVTTTDRNGDEATERRVVQVVETKECSKKPRLSNIEVAEFVVFRKIKSPVELYAAAKVRKDEGQVDLASFILNRSKASVTELIKNAWELNDAPKKLQRAQLSRLQVVQEVAKSECVPGCGGEWIRMAQQVLNDNDVHLIEFGKAVKDLLVNGRGKYRNIMITGPANCGKTFLLSPLQDIFDTFCNPAQNKFAWLGAESKEVIFLNDFRYSSELISWHVFLGLLEGALERIVIKICY